MYNPLRISSFILVYALICGVYAESVDVQENNITTLPSTSTSLDISTTTVKPPQNISCEEFNNDCKACVARTECSYCDEDNTCKYYMNKLLDRECKIKNVHYLTCRVNAKTLMIMVSVMIGIALLIILCVCCYCCCKRKGVKLSKDDLKWARQREERKQIADEKRKERAERTEEIRKKYGLVKDSNPYQRFDA